MSGALSEPVRIERTTSVDACRRWQVPIAFVMLLCGQWYCVAMYVRRTTSWQERLPELFALLTAAWLISIREGNRETSRSLSPGTFVAPLLVVAVTFGRVPELLSLVLGSIVFVLLLRQSRLAGHVGIWGLVVLGMPVLSRLPLFLGYPMRIATGMLAAPLLRTNGINAVREGTVFRVGERMIVIDAPCSGTNMLWAAVWVVLTLAALRAVSNGRAVVLTILAMGLVVVANAVRSSALVLAEVRGIELSTTAHSAVGLVCYAGLIGAIGFLVYRCVPTNIPSQSPAPAPVRVPALQWSGFALACLVCAISPLFLNEAQAGAIDDPVWPTSFAGKPLTRVELQPYEQRYAAEFPGRMARFSDGSRQIMFQWLPSHSRSVHSAAECLQNSGYEIEHGPIIVDGTGMKWSSCTARKGQTAIRLRERIEDSHGRHWQDVSSWYWDATLDRTNGPYWFVIVTESI